jgi:hypothetical protein
MSATRDTSSQTKFVFSNFYHLYLQSKAAKASEDAEHLAKGLVIRASRMTGTPTPAQVQVVSSHHQESIKTWANPEITKGRNSMAEQMNTLRTARKRLNYLMEEIDEILKRE